MEGVLSAHEYIKQMSQLIAEGKSRVPKVDFPNSLNALRELFRFLPLCQKCREEKQQDEKQKEWLFSSLINANQSWAFSKWKECSLLMNTLSR
ncbi:hypothetical protein CEXT_569291 [Caerostris extrusa]|uniref:Uncharacterized protein n=1 Tax=Caerostris extrusa TaxID=172846 RepID=A0AAV4UPR6_CAEEX|nr:hypothetical protein CEXT_569291 [Caerostris extrusa]